MFVAFAAPKTDAEMTGKFDNVDFKFSPFQEYSPASLSSLSVVSSGSSSASGSSLSSVSDFGCVSGSFASINAARGPLSLSFGESQALDAELAASSDSCTLASEVSDLVDAEDCQVTRAVTTDASIDELEDCFFFIPDEELPLKFREYGSACYELSKDDIGRSVQELWGYPAPCETRVVKKLGQGGFGAVYHVEALVNGSWVDQALKILPRNSGCIASFKTEIKTSERLRNADFDFSDRVALVQDYCFNELALFLVYDFYPAGALLDYMRNYGVDNETKLRIFSDLAYTLEEFHRVDIAHADIKTENILVTERDGRPFPVIADLGLCRHIEFGDVLTEQIGTPQFMAPEVCDFGGEGWGPLADVYSLGATLHELYFGMGWWEMAKGNWEEKTMLGCTDEWFTDIPPTDPAAILIEDLIIRCCVADPAFRPAACLIADEVRHRLAYADFAGGSLAESYDVVEAWNIEQAADTF